MNENIDLPKLADNDAKSENIESKVESIKEDIVYEKSFKGFIKYLTTQDKKGLFNLVLRLLLIIIIIILCKFPFDLIKDLGTNLMTSFSITITDSLLNIWTSIINIIYYILAIIFFFKIVKERYFNLTNKK